MSSELDRQAHALFVRSIDIDASRRGAFISESCGGNDALEAKVRRLVGAVDRSTHFLETPALSSRLPEGGAFGGAIDPTLIRVPGYRVVRVIGSGGMATVYEAVQAQPERTVALKVMNRGLTSTSAVRRFKYETEVLARLQHPGIAQIFEAGTSDDGTGRPLPFFAMELVPGARTLTEHAQSNGLSLVERLGMFMQVCEAVEHGHQVGVIHRDLKPANILVDASGRTKIIDFGIARPIDAERADITRRADIGNMIGTLNYMSPEQCTGHQSVDLRTDVYSLGVILYQLVSGVLPHDLSRASIPEAVRMISDELPPRLGAVCATARGDLEAIAAKAMEKTPARRYSGPPSLVADIRRYLNHEPIEARPATTLYQVRKFARRHRPLVAGISGAFLMLIVGITATARMAYVANQARSEAERREAELEQVADFQQSQLSGIDIKEMGDRIRASLLDKARESRLRLNTNPDTITHDLADLDRLLGSVNFTSFALTTLDQNVLQRSHQAIDTQFADQPLLRARLLQTLAGTMNSLGLFTRAEPVLSGALRIRREELGDDHPDTLISLHSMGSLLTSLGRNDEAYVCLRDAYERRSRVLGAEHRSTLATGTSLGGVLRNLGKLDEAERIWRVTFETQRRVLGADAKETLHSLNNIGVLHAVQGKFADAEACWRELLERRRRTLNEAHPDYRRTLTNLSGALQEQGKLAEAKPLVEESLAVARREHGDDHENTLFAMSRLAWLLKDLKEWPAAEALIKECIDRRTRALGPEHSDTVFAQVTLVSLLTQKHRETPISDADLVDAERTIRNAIIVQRRDLGDDHADTLDSINYLAELLCEMDRCAEAEPLCHEAVDRARRARPAGHWSIGQFLTQYGRTLHALKRWPDARAALVEGHTILDSTRGHADAITLRAVQSLAELFEDWDQASPGGGHDIEARQWQERLGSKPRTTATNK